MVQTPCQIECRASVVPQLVALSNAPAGTTCQVFPVQDKGDNTCILSYHVRTGSQHTFFQTCILIGPPPRPSNQSCTLLNHMQDGTA